MHAASKLASRMHAASTIMTQSTRAQSEYAAGALPEQKSGGTVTTKSCGVSSPAIVTRANETFSLSMWCFIARVMHNLDAEHACSVGICGWCEHKTEVRYNRG